MGRKVRRQQAVAGLWLAWAQQFHILCIPPQVVA